MSHINPPDEDEGIVSCDNCGEDILDEDTIHEEGHTFCSEECQADYDQTDEDD